MELKLKQKTTGAPAGGTELGTAYCQIRSLESFRHDGAEIARIRPQRREWPLRHLLLFVLAVMSFKIFLYFDMGAAAYGAKIEELAQGGLTDRLAARAMVLDPVSEWFVGGVRFGRW
ncbi:MAG: hypothetical protein GY717_21330 [Rhodobacteraceae bacterium]|nr:hypothetical protein [Paracoccaceae bacterium]